MKKYYVLLLVVLSMFNITSIKADEGMWLPILVNRLNYADMQKMGLKLSPEEIYSINNSSLKDAIVKFGKGCSGSIISPEGLLLTAHHCALPYIQANSTVALDYLANGYWAATKQEELPCPGLTVTFLIKIEDVTDKILKEINENMTESMRKSKIAQISKKIEEEAVGKTHYTAEVKGFYNDNEFYLFVYETFNDVRLVGAPSNYIGNFGGDKDNWMWPRHTCDFSIFRVYTAPDGKPAPYSKDNIPYKSKYYLPISLKGVKNDDFVFALGYPAKTTRYLTSHYIKQLIEETNPAKIAIRDKKLSILKVDMAKNPEIRLKYISKYNNISNYYKNWIGELKQLVRNSVYQKKKQQEDAFQNWIYGDPKRIEKYGKVLSDIDEAYKQINKYNLFYQYYDEVIRRGTDIISLAFQFRDLYLTLTSTTKEISDPTKLITESFKESIREHFRSYNMETDKKVFVALFKMFYDNVPKSQHPDFFENVTINYDGDFNRYADYVYNNSIFADGAKIWNFLKKVDYKVLEKDPAFKIMLSSHAMKDKIDGYIIEAKWKQSKAERLYVQGLQEMYPDKKFYPDANSTMRLTYGKVEGYSPADGLIAKYYTTLDGLIQKEDPKDEEFIVPERLKELYQRKDYGEYAEDGILRVNFISNTDVSGGSSGSAVLNAEGHIVGIIFDGNWEALSLNLAYEPNFQRTISVDIRYVLFIIDKYANAQNILNELKIIKS